MSARAGSHEARAIRPLAGHGFENANIAESADPALLHNLSSMLHRIVAAQRNSEGVA